METLLVDQLDRSEYRNFLTETIVKGQRCQRNWDLAKEMPEEDVEVVVRAATEVPSKQNLDFYSVMVIRNRELQEKIYNITCDKPGGRYNPQVLAHTLLAFIPKQYQSEPRNAEVLAQWVGKGNDEVDTWLKEDRDQAIGVAAGAVNVVSQSLGYSTGCCKCFDHSKLYDLLGLDLDEVPPGILLMGVGIKDTSRNRREDHKNGVKIVSCQKIPLDVTYIN